MVRNHMNSCARHIVIYSNFELEDTMGMGSKDYLIAAKSNLDSLLPFTSWRVRPVLVEAIRQVKEARRLLDPDESEVEWRRASFQPWPTEGD